jgi:ATP-dependent DNA helicase RecG
MNERNEDWLQRLLAEGESEKLEFKENMGREDEVIEPRATLEDLDAGQIQRFRKRCNQKGRRPIPADDDALTVLDKLKLLEGGQPIRATVLLFSASPQRFYPQARIRIGRFRTPTLIVDDREIGGSLFDQAEAVMHYFRERLQTRYVFEGTPTREVVWEYPLEALREAVINAICHRDYMDHGHVQVRWYDDRIVFLNPGGLPASLRIEDLKREHRSVLRNRKIAGMLFYAGFIEQWGSGTLRMIQECVTAGLPEPEFEERQEALWVTFRKHELDEGRLRAEGFNERQVKAALFAQAQGRITSRDYRQLNQVSPKTAYLELDELVGRGWLIREGGGSTSGYVLAR